MSGSVIRGNATTQEGRYMLDGILTTPTQPRVTIRDSAGVVQLQDAIPTQISTGIFQHTYVVPLDALLGNWQWEWSGTIAGQSPAPAIDITVILPIGAIVSPPSSTYTYNLSTDVGRVRLLTDDRDMTLVSLSLPLEQRSAIFTDEEIATFLADNGGNVYSAAAVALITIAGNRSLLVMRRNIGKTDVDYGSVRKDLLAQAEALQKQAAVSGTYGPADGYAEINYDDFSLRRIIANAAIRGD